MATKEEQELIVLVDEHNNEIGTMPKLAAHNADTPLHRAFSIFLFNGRGQLLLQQRSRHKKTWPLIWSNSCCGHPAPGESTEAAIHRRLEYELGLTNVSFEVVLPDYRYRFERDGIVENEICPVYAGRCDQIPRLNPKEVEAIKYIAWEDFLKIAKAGIESYTEWALEEAQILQEAMIIDKDKQFRKLWDLWYNK